ncbi:MMPL family transporter [Conexibacter sp. W3-3-2]|uniref:MMPL family transporter n=1 Tax=Conexibacter sp. W3-3-2 TaxID=2675227 RepID=UPI0018AB9B38|nr:MMPL family transporter [Conexibacter sp. W3-3-2]
MLRRIAPGGVDVDSGSSEYLSVSTLVLRHPRLTLTLTTIFAVVALVLGGPVAGLLKTGRDNFEDRGSESALSREALVAAAGRSPEADIVVLVEAARTLDQRVLDTQKRLAAIPEIATTVSPRQPQGRRLRTPDGRSSVILGYLRPMETQTAQDVSVRVSEEFRGLSGVSVGGPVLTTAQIRDQVSEDLRKAELLAFPLLFLLLLFVFRGLVAALLPLLVAVLSVLGTLLALRLAVQITDLSVFALNLITALGLGLAIDYSLFIIARYREEAAEHGYGHLALTRTLATAGRTVMFSSLTVALALSVFPQRFLMSMAVGGALVALVAGAAALLALPPALLLLGPRIDALSLRRSPRRPERSYSARIGARVMRRPGVVAVVTGLALVVVGLPFADVRFTGFDATVLPESASSRQVADRVAESFPGDRTAPLIVALRSTDRFVAAEARERLFGVENAAAVSEPVRVGNGLTRIDVYSTGPPLAEPSQRLVDGARQALTGLPAQITGEAARYRDSRAALNAALPVALGIVGVTTVALLFLMCGSVLLPLCALAMNLLTISAAFGVLVLIFQDGRLEGTLAYTSQGALDASQMVLLFVLVFALSTDYGVFVLGRIKEARDSGMPSREAVVAGMGTTGPLVTAAAVLFCVAIGAFATSEVVFIKEVGIGTAFAVLIDATVVRALLLPALMGVLGERAWAAPRLLRRLHGRFGLRESSI